LQAALDVIAQNTKLVHGSWNGLNVLHLTAARTAALDLGFQPGQNSVTDRREARFVYLLGADEFKAEDFHPDAFIVYQGHHGDLGALQADVILPGPAYTEKSGVYVNTEGRTQITRAATDAPAGAREDWKIVAAVAEAMGQPLPYQTTAHVRTRLADVAPHFALLNDRQTVSYVEGHSKANGHPVVIDGAQRLSPALANHFTTDPISRSSKTLAKCAATLKNATNSYVKDASTTKSFMDL